MRFPSLKVDADTIAREAGSPRYCPHVTTELRNKIDKAGGARLWNQCLTCGSPVGTRVSAKPYTWHQVHDMPLFDEDLRRSYLRAYFTRYEARRVAEIEHLKAECREAFQRYLQTPEWRAKRDLVFVREQRLCEGCRSAPATDAHHTTYAHIGEEFLFELVAVCRQCHDVLHESEFPRFLDSLYYASYPSVEDVEHIRIKISVHLNQQHALSEKDLDAMKPALERAVAGALPDSVSVDTIKVTRIKEASPRKQDTE